MSDARPAATEPSTSLLFDVFALSQAVGRLLDAAMADSPLRPAEYAFYSAVFELESVTPSGLAARLGMPLTTVMDQVARLERRGHASRMVDPGDRRATRVVLTAAGRQTHRAANRSFEAVHALLDRALPVSEAEAKRALALIRAAVEEAARAAAPSAARSG